MHIFNDRSFCVDIVRSLNSNKISQFNNKSMQLTEFHYRGTSSFKSNYMTLVVILLY